VDECKPLIGGVLCTSTYSNAAFDVVVGVVWPPSLNPDPITNP
jgi:hypothetical protein